MAEFKNLIDEADAFLNANPDLVHLDGFIIDLAGKSIGKRYQADTVREIFERGSSMCAAMQLTDVTGECWDVAGLGFSDGDPDSPTKVVPGTLSVVPWAKEPRAQCMLRLYQPDGKTPVWYDPRTILEGVLKKLSALNLTPVVAIELEFYLIDRNRNEDGSPNPPTSPISGRTVGLGRVFNLEEISEFDEVISAIENSCKVQGLPVTTMIGEYGPGQFEINLQHVGNAIEAADHAILMRRAVKETARSVGYDATFMPKPYGDLAGSGLQINVSITDHKGQNIFNPGTKDGEAKLRNVVAGLQATLADGMAIFAPSLNGFRRYEPNQFTPVNFDWAENNRSVAFRIPASDPDNRRVEHRAAGADANPYLVMAAVLAGAHYGLENKLEPTAIEEGNRSEDADPKLPVTIWDALNALENSIILPSYLTERYIEAYCGVKRAEFNALLSEISPREYDWYL